MSNLLELDPLNLDESMPVFIRVSHHSFSTFSKENDSKLGRSSHSHKEGVTEATGPLPPNAEEPIAGDVGCFVFCGLVGSKDRPKKAQSCTQDWYRTQLRGLQVMLLPGVNLSISHLLPSDWDILPGTPNAMLTPTDAVLDVVAIVKVGKTLGGSQLMNIANLPAVHYPFVLGIPRQMPCAPFTVEHQDALTDSLFLLLKLFVTGPFHDGLQLFL